MTPLHSAPVLVLVGGIPGAGKSVALREVARTCPGVRVLDSAAVRERLRPVLGRWPYGLWRPVVHGVHYARLAGSLARGADVTGPLLVHDTATRPAVRALIGTAARAGGWCPVLVAVDVDPAEALRGQRRRGRLVRTAAFARHVHRWEALREQLLDGAPGGHGPWAWAGLVPREDAADRILEILAGDTPARVGGAAAGDGSGEAGRVPHPTRLPRPRLPRPRPRDPGRSTRPAGPVGLSVPAASVGTSGIGHG